MKIVFAVKVIKNNKEVYFHTDNFLQDKRIVLCEQCLADLGREVDRALI
jgi:hypothetical protein